MKTYTDYKPFIDNPNFKADRQVALNNLDINLIDSPLITLVEEINRLPYLFTLQCCNGHFLNEDGKEISNLGLSETNERVVYKLAYIAFSIENSLSGRNIRQSLMNIPLSIDREKVQFCSAQWFWEQWSNTYVLQVMPKRFKDLDSVRLDYTEAREIKKIRDNFFASLNDFIAKTSN